LPSVAADPGAPGAGEPEAPPRGAGEETSAVPRRAEGVELIGDFDASGYRRAPSLVRRGDGQVIQLTSLLYAALEAVDGRRDLKQIAEAVGASAQREVSEDNARVLVEQKLTRCGLVVGPDGKEPEVAKVDSLLALRLRFTVFGENLTNRLTAPFAVLLTPVVMIPAVVAFFAVVFWLLTVRGLGGGTRQLLYSPGLLLLILAATALSAGFHEFGHAAALKYSGGKPGRIGGGLYLVWPAFFTDVTDAYRLDRRGRLRTDVGGLYFNILFTLATVAVWKLTGAEAVLVLVPLQLVQMTHQLLPVVRLDGYYILSDLCGVPDLFTRIKPMLLRLVPGRGADRKVTDLKPWVQVVVTVWILLVIPLLLAGLLFAAISFPRMAATAWDSASLQWRSVGRWLDAGSWAGALAGLIGTASVMLPVAASVYVLSRVARKATRKVWSVAGRAPAGRLLAAVAGLALAAGLAWLWWPNGEYRPIQPGERGTLGDAVRAVGEIPGGRPALTEERQAELGGAPRRSDAPPAQEPAPPFLVDEDADDTRPPGVAPGPSTTVRASPGPTAPSTTMPAPTTTGPAPTTTRPAPTTTRPPPTTTAG